MKARKRLIAALAVPVLAGTGALAAAGSAHAATGYTDTSVQADNFQWDHQVVGTASDTDVGTTRVDVTGLRGAFAPGNTTSTYLKCAITSDPDVDGVQLSVTPINTGPVTQCIITADGHLAAGATPPVQTTATMTETDSYGDVAVVTLTLGVSSNAVQKGSPATILTDEVYQITNVNENGNGSVLFAAKNTADSDSFTFSESNLPSGLASGNPVLPGSAVPGTYNDMLVTAKDSQGAQATGSFRFVVNGAATPAAPVPVLSHGAAVYVAATRENVYVQTTLDTWAEFTIVGPGAINGHQGWVHLNAGSNNVAVYSGLEANHGYTVYYKPVGAQGSSVQTPGTEIGYVFFVSNRP